MALVWDHVSIRVGIEAAGWENISFAQITARFVNRLSPNSVFPKWLIAHASASLIWGPPVLFLDPTTSGCLVPPFLFVGKR